MEIERPTELQNDLSARETQIFKTRWLLRTVKSGSKSEVAG